MKTRRSLRAREHVASIKDEALDYPDKKAKTIDVNLSKPMSLEEVYASLAKNFGSTVDALKADSKQTAERMRKFTYQVSENYKQELDMTNSPKKIK